MISPYIIIWIIMPILSFSSSRVMSFTTNDNYKEYSGSKNTYNNYRYCVIGISKWRFTIRMISRAIIVRKRNISILRSVYIFAALNITSCIRCRLKIYRTTFCSIFTWILITNRYWSKATIFHSTIVGRINKNILSFNDTAASFNWLDTEIYKKEKHEQIFMKKYGLASWWGYDRVRINIWVKMSFLLTRVY